MIHLLPQAIVIAHGALPTKARRPRAAQRPTSAAGLLAIYLVGALRKQGRRNAAAFLVEDVEGVAGVGGVHSVNADSDLREEIAQLPPERLGRKEREKQQSAHG